MRWRFGRLGRIFRRLWRLMMYTQLVSPVVACLAILSASALGIDLDKQVTFIICIVADPDNFAPNPESSSQNSGYWSCLNLT